MEDIELFNQHFIVTKKDNRIYVQCKYCDYCVTLLGKKIHPSNYWKFIEHLKVHKK